MIIPLFHIIPAHLIQLLQTLDYIETGSIVIGIIMNRHLQPLQILIQAPILSLTQHGLPLLLSLKLLSTYLNALMKRVGRYLNRGKIPWRTRLRACLEEVVESASS